MSKFLDCLCDENIQSLIIDGVAPTDELMSAWMQILSEYIELQSDDEEEQEAWVISREIARVEDHLFLLDVCIGMLSEQYSEAIASSVRKLGYPFNPKSTNPEEYYSLLKTVVNKAKTKKVKLSQLNKDLQERLRAHIGTKPDRTTYEKRLLHYEEMQRVGYDIDGITVYKFVILEKKFSQKAKLTEQKHQKHARTN